MLLYSQYIYIPALPTLSLLSILATLAILLFSRYFVTCISWLELECKFDERERRSIRTHCHYTTLVDLALEVS